MADPTPVPAATPAPEDRSPTPPPPRRRLPWFLYVLTIVLVAAATIGVLLLMQNIFTRQREAEQVVFKLVDVDEETIDPEIWGQNFPRQYDTYLRTVDIERTKHGGSEAFQKLDEDPRWRVIFDGYAFAIDHREERGHAYMLHDQDITERVRVVQQWGACLHCHASVTSAYRQAGAAAGVPAMTGGGLPHPPASPAAAPPAATQPAPTPSAPRARQPLGPLAAARGVSHSPRFQWPQVMKGFEIISGMRWEEARQHVSHPISCVDCHDPDTVQLRITRPGFIYGIQALARSDDPVPHLPSVERWRQGSRQREYDPNLLATRQEMRSFACAQCHVEYYFHGEHKLPTYPWHKGLKVEQIEAYYDEVGFKDWTHATSGAPVLKAQHPEFEMWSQGIHARSGVACADCHMPYMREGAIKVSDHQVRSPLLNIARACQTCHRYPEQEILARAETIQDRTKALMDRAEDAVVELINAIAAAAQAGAGDEQLKLPRDFQRKAQWRLDFVAAENSLGFHASQESARILGEAIDLARQGQIHVLEQGRE